MKHEETYGEMGETCRELNLINGGSKQVQGEEGGGQNFKNSINIGNEET